jgi:polar amino acid transport system substrate-binding protein
VYHAGRDPKKSLGYIDKPLAFQPYCFGVRKFDQEWLNYVNFFIYRLQQSGKMKELYKKWFNAEPFRVSPIW